MFFLAIFLPPVAVFIRKGPVAALLNLVLCFCGVLPGIIHAVWIVSSTNADARSKKVEEAIKQNTKTLQSHHAVNDLERLATLKAEGHLSQEEFDAKKQQLIQPKNVLGKDWYKTWWGIMLIISFFPFFISYYIWQQKWDVKVRVGVIAAMWIVLALAALSNK